MRKIKEYLDSFGRSRDIWDLVKWTGAGTLLTKAWAWLFGVVPSSELLFWALVPITWFLGIVFLTRNRKLPQIVTNVSELTLLENPESKNDLALLLYVTIRNRGVTVPCSIEGESWRIVFVPSSGNHVQLPIRHPSDGVLLRSEVKLPSDAAIYVRAQRPLIPGGITNGYVYCPVPKIPREQLLNPAARITIRFIDVFGREHVFKTALVNPTVVSSDDPIPYMLGMEKASGNQVEAKK